MASPPLTPSPFDARALFFLVFVQAGFTSVMAEPCIHPTCTCEPHRLVCTAHHLEGGQWVVMHEVPRIVGHAHLPRLQETDFRYNKIEYVGPNAFHGLNKLKQLWLSHNQIVNVSAKAFNNLASVEMIDLSYNRLRRIQDGVFASTPPLQNLLTIDLSYNDITAFDQGCFLPVSNLQQLYLHHNPLGELNPNSFSYMPTLDILSLAQSLPREAEDLTDILQPLPTLRTIFIAGLVGDCTCKWLVGIDTLKNMNVDIADELEAIDHCIVTWETECDYADPSKEMIYPPPSLNQLKINPSEKADANKARNFFQSIPSWRQGGDATDSHIVQFLNVDSRTHNESLLSNLSQDQEESDKLQSNSVSFDAYEGRNSTRPIKESRHLFHKTTALLVHVNLTLEELVAPVATGNNQQTTNRSRNKSTSHVAGEERNSKQPSSVFRQVFNTSAPRIPVHVNLTLEDMVAPVVRGNVSRPLIVFPDGSVFDLDSIEGKRALYQYDRGMHEKITQVVDDEARERFGRVFRERMVNFIRTNYVLNSPGENQSSAPSQNEEDDSTKPPKNKETQSRGNLTVQDSRPHFSDGKRKERLRKGMPLTYLWMIVGGIAATLLVMGCTSCSHISQIKRAKKKKAQRYHGYTINQQAREKDSSWLGNVTGKLSIRQQYMKGELKRKHAKQTFAKNSFISMHNQAKQSMDAIPEEQRVPGNSNYYAGLSSHIIAPQRLQSGQKPGMTRNWSPNPPPPPPLGLRRSLLDENIQTMVTSQRLSVTGGQATPSEESAYLDNFYTDSDYDDFTDNDEETDLFRR